MPPGHIENRPKSRSIRPLRALLPYLRPYRLQITFAIFALLVAAAALLMLPIALRYVIDAGIASDDAGTINGYFIALAGVTLLFAVFAAWRYYLMTWIGERVVADLRRAVFRHLMRLDQSFFETTQSGEVLSRLTTDTTLVQSITGSGFSIAIRTGLQLVGALALLAITSPALTGYILVTIPVVLVPIILIGRRVRGLSRDSQDRIADSSGLAGETLNAMALVQSYTLESKQSERYGGSVEQAYVAAIRRARVRAFLTAYAISALFLAITFILWLGAHAVIDGSMSPGQLGQFLLYAIFVGSAAAGLSEQWGELQRAAGAIERLVELLHQEPAIQAPAVPRAPVLGSGTALIFDDVRFSYPSRPNTNALDGFTLRIAEGETVALVGPSGAGKSTVFQLLLRFYDYQSGDIRVGDTVLRDMDPVALRGLIGVVPQDPVIFAASARENIRLGRLNATDVEIEQAAQAAAADEFIRALPEGYDTFLGERGVRLSVGQRQRIAIARAILKNPYLLLLDEATSALDAQSERLVQQAIERLTSDRTTLVIAHRLATVLKADRIALIDHGRLLDVGTHTELMQRAPLYARLARLQFIDGQIPVDVDAN
ncbi:MAG: ATP-binding cassette domain-containing protein [Gammaproteobacteria bacterium]|nr:ATP-binding cassette domain-containing protein [Gammaproteobacteria bacterium]